MDPGTLLIICFVLAKMGVNAWQDSKALAKGQRTPRQDRAAARTARRDHKSWWDPIGDYLHEALADSLSGGIETRRRRSAARRDGAHERWLKRHEGGRTVGARLLRWASAAGSAVARGVHRGAPDTASAEKGATATPETKPANDTATPAAATKPVAAPATPPATSAPTDTTPETQGATMPSGINIPPHGEITNLPAAVARTDEWVKFMSGFVAEVDTAKLTPASWRKACERGASSAEANLNYFETHNVKGPAVEAYMAAKEKLSAVMGPLAAQQEQLLVQFGEAASSALAEFNRAATELAKHGTVREAYSATGNNAGSKEFVTSGG